MSTGATCNRTPSIGRWRIGHALVWAICGIGVFISINGGVFGVYRNSLYGRWSDQRPFLRKALYPVGRDPHIRSSIRGHYFDTVGLTELEVFAYPEWTFDMNRDQTRLPPPVLVPRAWSIAANADWANMPTDGFLREVGLGFPFRMYVLVTTSEAPPNPNADTVRSTVFNVIRGYSRVYIPGVIYNALSGAFAGLLALFAYVFFVGYKRSVRTSKGLCEWCKYPRAGIDIDRACPECGKMPTIRLHDRSAAKASGA
jgi:hypothetical protein